MGVIEDSIVAIGGLGLYFGHSWLVGAFLLVFFFLLCVFTLAGMDTIIIILIGVTSLLASYGLLPEAVWFFVLVGVGYQVYKAYLRITQQG
jgi:hypothetical protein